MNETLPCGIVRDLLPGYADGATSAASSEAVAAHLAACPECRAALEAMQSTLPGALPLAPDETDRQAVCFMKRQKRKARLRLLSVFLAAAVLFSGFTFYLTTAEHPVPVARLEVTQLCRLADGRIYFELNGTGAYRSNLYSKLWSHSFADEKRCDFGVDFTLGTMLFEANSGPRPILLAIEVNDPQLDAIYYTDETRSIEQKIWARGDTLPPASAEIEARMQKQGASDSLYVHQSQ